MDSLSLFSVYFTINPTKTALTPKSNKNKPITAVHFREEHGYLITMVRSENELIAFERRLKHFKHLARSDSFWYQLHPAFPYKFD